MEIVFFIGITALIVALICWSAVLLRFFINKFAGVTLSFGNAVLFLILWSLVSSLIALPVYYFVPAIPSILVNLVIGYGVFYYLLKRKNPTSYAKALKAYLLFWFVAGVTTILVVALVRSLVFSPFVVAGQAMNPTFQTGDYLVIDMLSNSYERGDVVVYEFKEGQYFVHRIIGLPNDQITIQDNIVSINGEPLVEQYVNGVTEWENKSIELGQDEYFIMGDNREHSNDSRFIGAISSDRILGEYFTKINLLSTSDWVE